MQIEWGLGIYNENRLLISPQLHQNLRPHASTAARVPHISSSELLKYSGQYDMDAMRHCVHVSNAAGRHQRTLRNLALPGPAECR